jgi:hypothetical protein
MRKPVLPLHLIAAVNDTVVELRGGRMTPLDKCRDALPLVECHSTGNNALRIR